MSSLIATIKVKMLISVSSLINTIKLKWLKFVLACGVSVFGSVVLCYTNVISLKYTLSLVCAPEGRTILQVLSDDTYYFSESAVVFGFGLVLLFSTMLWVVTCFYEILMVERN